MEDRNIRAVIALEGVTADDLERLGSPLDAALKEKGIGEIASVRTGAIELVVCESSSAVSHAMSVLTKQHFELFEKYPEIDGDVAWFDADGHMDSLWMVELPYFEIERGEAIAQWRERLVACRQDWAEWEQLLTLVDSIDWQLAESHNTAFQNYYLVEPVEGKRISMDVHDPRVVEMAGRLTADNSAFPALLLAICGLKCSDRVDIAGGIAGYAILRTMEGITSLAVTPTADGIDHQINCKSPDEIIWPKDKAYVLQSNDSGGWFCTTVAGDIVAFSSAVNAFVRVGAIDDFLRYCLASTLARRDWYRDYIAGRDVDAYGLRVYDDVGID